MSTTSRLNGRSFSTLDAESYRKNEWKGEAGKKTEVEDKTNERKKEE